MPALYKDDALKAQTIASRSYLLSKSDEEIITTSTKEQAFLANYELYDKWGSDYDKYIKKFQNIIIDTDNMVIKRDDKILKTYYFSMSNGYTENSITVFNEKLFESVASPYEENNKNFKVSNEISKVDLCNLLGVENVIIGDIVRTDTNHVDSIIINNKKYLGTEIRKILNLRSTDFEVKENDDSYTFTTRGYGHGVGMSQIGANELAKMGYDFKYILNYYYKDTIIDNV